MSNIDHYQNCVLNSIKNLRKRFNIQIIPIFNNGNIYSSSIAGNISLECSKTRYHIYLHQDVSFGVDSADLLFECLKNKDDNCALIGSAGVDVNSKISDAGKWGNNSKSIEFGGVKNSLGEIVWGENKISGLVHSLDEMILIFDRNIRIKFDPVLKGYHLYGLDICLQARSAGYDILAVPLDLKHHGEYSSSICHDRNFLKRLIYIHDKWLLQFNYVSTPYCHWSNNEIVSYIPFSLINENDRIDVTRFKIELRNAPIKRSLLTPSS